MVRLVQLEPPDPLVLPELPELSDPLARLVTVERL